MKLDILAFGAHPDDVELGAGGTVAKEVALGRKVGIIDLTRGELGSRGSVELRDEEAIESSRILGIDMRVNLSFRDGFFANDEAHQLEIVKWIRYCKPDIVLCNATEDRHPDHAKGSSLVSHACFLAGLSKVITLWEEEVQEAWRPNVVYHYIQDRYIKPDFVVDITDFMEAKMQSVKAYKSQFFNSNYKSNEPTTAISSKEFIEFLIGRTVDMGRQIKTSYGEGFVVERFVGVNSLMDIR